MRDNDKTSSIVAKGNNKGINGIDIKMVCGLVHNHDMRVSPGSHGQGNPGLLTSRKEVDRPNAEVASDSEVAEVGSDTLCCGIRELGSELLEGG